MKRNPLITFSIAAAIFLSAASLALPQAKDAEPNLAGKIDDRPDPLSSEQRAMRQQALQAQLRGKAKAYGKIHQVARGQFVELEREGEDPVWTVLGEFGDFPHNNIAEPDRSVDNTTIWVPDFNREHYLDMLFAEGKGANSMRQYYIEQSSNRYTVYGDVTDWALAPDDACNYDDDRVHPDGGNAVWYFLRDTVNSWYANEIAAGKTPAEINDYLSQFDVWDRYDWDGDGIFDEPDGYIDHMNFLHAGEGNEAGGGALGDCAIWSHSWFAFFNLIGLEGPSPEFLIGGLQIGESAYWLNKYIINPENGGVGVFAHEYGHDLGLPDLYDYTGTNSAGFWTLMSSGSWLSQSEEDIGSAPVHMGVWEKFQLGWLNYEVAFAGDKSEHKLGPAETNTKQAQGLFVVLPDKEVTTGPPFEGDYYYYSSRGNNMDNFMYKTFDPDGGTLQAMVNYDIEVDWDYAYLVVSTDGTTWTSLETNLSTPTNPYGQNFGYGITGSSGGDWVQLTADLSAYTDEVLLGFRYWTDGFVANPGIKIDAIEITGYPLDGAESDTGWTYNPVADGFHATEEIVLGTYFNAYVAEFRQYRGYDAGLANAYNFVGPPWLWAERFPYQDGLLISYWDTSFADNNVGANCAAGRCGGLLLPIDAHPDSLIRADGNNWSNRVQTYDSTFSLDPTDAITLHWLHAPSDHPSLPAVPIFDDNNSYYDPANPTGSVITPVTGTQIRIKSISAHGSFMQVQVRPSK